MKKTEIKLIKLGGSLITYKQDQKRIDQYLSQIDRFMTGKGSLDEITEKISELTNFEQLNRIFQVISSYLSQNIQKKLVLIHGAGSIGHSLVLHIMKTQPNLQEGFPIIKLAVSIQNQIVVATAIKNGIKAISFPSHPILTGFASNKISSKKANPPDLAVFEQIIVESDAIPVFYGDVGISDDGWKVFSGDIYPAALIKSQNRTLLSEAIFLTNVKGRKTGIYTKDPSFRDAKFITRIEADTKESLFYDSSGNNLTFISGESKSKYDVTDAMGGKLRNLIELANNHTKSWVVGFDEFELALNGNKVGTSIVSKRKPSINVVFLGTGDAFGSNGLHCSSVLIEKPNQSILLDCGPQTLPMLKKIGRSAKDIDIILISHFHGDHMAGVPFLFLDSIFQNKRTTPLKIIGPPGIEDQLKKLSTALYEILGNQDLSFQCDYFVTNPDNPIELNGIKIEAIKTVHTPESQGYRLSIEELILAYSGDTGWTEELFKLVKDTELSILECNFYDFQSDIHLNYSEITKLIPFSNRLAIIHLGSEALDKIPKLKTDDNLIIPVEGQEIRI